MPTPQMNIRLSPDGRKLLEQLRKHFSRQAKAETGREATQVEVVERALRALAQRENVT